MASFARLYRVARTATATRTAAARGFASSSDLVTTNLNSDGVALLTFNAPKSLNAMTADMGAA